ncbi:hypothetical protein N9A25_00235 [bacterium]|nr:hypothetical protein [bacterium]
MLFETPYQNGDTVSLKLSSGEEVIGRLEEETKDSIKLHKPLMLTMSQQGIGLAPFMFTANPDASITLKQDKVICIVKTIDEMSKQYISNTTGIVT